MYVRNKEHEYCPEKKTDNVRNLSLPCPNPRGDAKPDKDLIEFLLNETFKLDFLQQSYLLLPSGVTHIAIEVIV